MNLTINEPTPNTDHHLLLIFNDKPDARERITLIIKEHNLNIVRSFELNSILNLPNVAAILSGQTEDALLNFINDAIKQSYGIIRAAQIIGATDIL